MFGVPDLSLQISPPADDHHIIPACFTKRPRSSDLTQENTFNHQHYFDHPRLSLGLEMVDHPFVVPLQPHQHYHLPRIYGHDFEGRSRNVRRSARAPRMRWTSTLHAHFIHAVQLLGGHERATPKSVQELMNVKDLTLAHVKSHLQMYRTVKSTDKGTAGLAHMQPKNPRTLTSLFEVSSPPTAVQRSSSLDSHYTTSSDSPPPTNHAKADEVLRSSKKIKLETNSLLDLEFTLGRPS